MWSVACFTGRSWFAFSRELCGCNRPAPSVILERSRMLLSLLILRLFVAKQTLPLCAEVVSH